MTTQAGERRDLPVLARKDSVHAQVLRPRGVHRAARANAAGDVAFRLVRRRRHPEVVISRLNGWPARTPVNASPPPSQTPAHDSGPSWIATPSMSGVLIPFLPPVYPGAPHVPCSSRRPGSRRLHTGHHLASKRAPARLFPKFYIYPGFDVVSCFSMLHQRIAFARLPDPRLTAFTPPFPQSLTTTVFSLCSMRRLDVSPRRATPKGHKTFIYYTALLHRGLPTLDLSFAFVAHMEVHVREQRRRRCPLR